MEKKLKTLGQVLASKGRQKVMEALEETLRTPTQLSKLTGLKSTYISRILHDLTNFQVVECKTPDLRKGRLYGLTTEGKEILESLKNAKKGLKENGFN